MFTKPIEAREMDIDLTPIINVIFLLLIFFVVQGSMNDEDVLQVNAPTSRFGTTVYTDPIEILVTDDELIINLELVDDAGLESILKDIVTTDANTEIMLKADKALEAVRLLEVLQKIQDSGAKNIFLVTIAPF